MGVKESQGEQSEDRGDVEAGMGMSELVLPHRCCPSEVRRSMLTSVACKRQKLKTVCSPCEQSMGLKALLLPLLSET